jgi:hypothetical protein
MGYNGWMEVSDNLDPLLALFGSGKDVWADERADEYVRRLRLDWESSSLYRLEDSRKSIFPRLT